MGATPTPTPALEVYRRTLPDHESRALEAWASTFYPFQARWLFEPADLAICNKARQIGMSHTTSAVGVLWGAMHGELTTVISIGQLESAEVLKKAKLHAAVLVKLGSKMARMVTDNATEITFASGGRMMALPSTGGRSLTGNVFLDEYAYQERPKEVWDAASAVTMLGFRMRVASTPNGVGNEFHGLWTRPGAGWAKHETTIDGAAADGYPVNLEKCWAIAKHDPRVFDQLFRCKFLDGEAQYIPTALIADCTVDDTTIGRGGEVFAGLDIGKTADLTVLVVLRRDAAGLLWVQHVESRKRTSSDDLDALASLAIETFGARRLCVDATGMGSFPAEDLQRRYGRHRVEPFGFTAQSKEDLATTMYQAFADRRLRLPRAEDKLREDVCAIRRIVTSAGNVRYDAPHTDDGHADRAWALALALHGASRPQNTRHERAYRDSDDAYPEPA